VVVAVECHTHHVMHVACVFGLLVTVADVVHVYQSFIRMVTM
jgi:hypothetical protein